MRVARIAAAVGAAGIGSAALAAPALAHGDEVPASEVWTRWTLERVPVVAAAVAVAFFVQGWLRLRRRGRTDHAGFDRLALFLTGVAVTLAGIVSPLDPLGEEYLQSAHMLQHVLLADAGVALMVVAVRGPLSVFFLPRPVLVPVARNRPLRRAARFLTRPSVAVTLWLGVLVAWHVPAMYELALSNTVAHDLEHISFIAVGTLVWILLIDPMRHGRLTLGERIAFAAVVFWAGQILAYVILFAPRPLFRTYVEQDERLLGLSPLTDQKLSGVVMMVEQMLTVGLCLLLLVAEARRRRASAAVLLTDELPA